jgi:hypothetical protein
MLGRMPAAFSATQDDPAAASSVRASALPCGGTAYLVNLPPRHVPAVRHADLARAWDAAREAAARGLAGDAREILFRHADGAVTRLALADHDARCWAGAVDTLSRLATLQGMALCLRLLALVELLSRAPELALLCRLEAGRASLHPALLRAAATLALNEAAGFDAAALRRLLPLGLVHPAA